MAPAERGGEVPRWSLSKSTCGQASHCLLVLCSAFMCLPVAVKISTFHCSNIPRLQHFKISTFQKVNISRFQYFNRSILQDFIKSRSHRNIISSCRHIIISANQKSASQFWPKSQEKNRLYHFTPPPKIIEN